MTLAESIALAGVIVSAAIPIAVAYFGWVISKSVSQIEDSQWHSRKLVEKKLELFDIIAPDLNLTYCFSVWIGYWKEVSPSDMIEAKRRLDKVVNIYRGILGEKFCKSYDEYIHTVFRTFTGRGRDALIKAYISGPDGDRRTDGRYEWIAEMETCFETSDVPRKQVVREMYINVMTDLRDSIGLKLSTTAY